ncbi:hypothetical protein [Streptomyces sp. NPDC007074]|uniref:hypothetical protein n=1 Tax=Streptomyces sp. NPDC007074 TaxID=3156764 RepID=UPI0033D75A41
MPEVVEVPAELAEEIAHDDPKPWPWLVDRDTDMWAVTPYTHDGDTVLLPFAGDMWPATRASVEAAYGPLVPEPHCPVCGTTLFWKDGVCELRDA